MEQRTVGRETSEFLIFRGPPDADSIIDEIIEENNKITTQTEKNTDLLRMLKTLRQTDHQIHLEVDRLKQLVDDTEAKEKEKQRIIEELKVRVVTLENEVKDRETKFDSFKKELLCKDIEDDQIKETAYQYGSVINDSQQQLQENGTEIEKTNMRSIKTEFQQITALRQEIQQLQKDLNDKDSENKLLLVKSDGAASNAKNNKIIDLQERIKRRDTTIAQLKKVQDDNKKQIELQELRQELKGCIATHSDQYNTEKDRETNNSRSQAQDYKIQKINVQFKEKCLELEHQATAYRKDIEQFQKQLSDKDRENQDLQRKISFQSNSFEDRESREKKMQRYVKEIEELKKHLQEKESELEQKNTRLSRFMVNQLSNNNPNITDLSDKNRPTKLGERYQELYDNNWTDAYDIVERYFKTDYECVETLIKILMDAKEFCDKEVKKQEDMLKLALLPNGKNETIPDHIYKQLKDFKKEIAVANVPEICENFFATISQSSSKGRVTLLLGDYVKECIELCWLMSLQDPPVIFGTKFPTMMEFDTNVFRSYTQSGKYVHFVVWPPMYLYEGGPILSKGVAQGYKPQSARSSAYTHHDYIDETQTEISKVETEMPSMAKTQFSKSIPNDSEWNREAHSQHGSQFAQVEASSEESYLHKAIKTDEARTVQTTKPTNYEWNDFKYYVKYHRESYVRKQMGKRFTVCHNYYIKQYGNRPNYIHN